MNHRRVLGFTKLILLSLSSNCGAPEDDPNVELLDSEVDSASQGLLPGSEWVTAGAFTKIYDPGLGETGPWYYNDHCFIQDPNTGTWHLFGITNPEPTFPDIYDVESEDALGHATAPSLSGPWTKRAPALTTDTSYGETHLWAPHVVLDNGVYHMFYSGGGLDPTNQAINLATSTDLFTWTRHPGGPLFTDGYQARDPMVIKHNNQWVMYYTATDDPQFGHHIVAYRTSTDLKTWSSRQVAFEDPSQGTASGSTESAYVYKRGTWFYLVIGPRPYHLYLPPNYPGSDIFASQNPFQFEISQQVGHIATHAAEVIDDGTNTWISHAGWGEGGVWLAPFEWHNAPVTGTELYAISTTGTNVQKWNGSGTSWTQVGGPASKLITGGFGTFAVQPISGDIYRYNNSPNSWTKVGGPATQFAVNASALYRRDNTGVWKWNGSGTSWTQIGGPASAIYAGGVDLYATNPITGDLYRYDNTPMSWTQIGGPGTAFAANANGVFGLNPFGVYQWSGRGTDWIQIGGPATALYAGGNTLCATAPSTGALNCYAGSPFTWTSAASSATSFAVGDNGVYASRSSGVYSVGSGGTGTQIGGPASTIAVGR